MTELSRRGWTIGASAAAVTLALGAPVRAAPSGSRLETVSLPTRLVPSPALYTVLLPPGYDPAGPPLPLMLLLHGGDGDKGLLARMQPIVEAAWAAGELPPLVVVTPDAHRSFYMDYKNGSERWESFITGELLADIRKRYRVSADRAKTVVSGVSMGGLGALRLGFLHPDLFGGLAALEPGIEPALSYDEVKPRNAFQRSEALFKEKFGDPIDRGFWKAFNPADIAIARRDALIASGLQIYLEAGDRDMFHLDEGTEFLHRVLWDHGILHEYRLVRGADHLGHTVPGRLRDGFRFLNRQVLNPPAPDDSYAAAKSMVEGLKRRAGVDDRAPRPPLPPTR